MPWDDSPQRGFTSGEPWLAVVDAPARNVADQERDPASLLALYRGLIALRPRLGRGLRFLDSAPDVLAYERGDHVVAVNLSERPAPAPAAGNVVLDTGGRQIGPAPADLAPLTGFVAER
jgi:glycosidase